MLELWQGCAHKCVRFPIEGNQALVADTTGSNHLAGDHLEIR